MQYTKQVSVLLLIVTLVTQPIFAYAEIHPSALEQDEVAESAVSSTASTDTVSTALLELPIPQTTEEGETVPVDATVAPEENVNPVAVTDEVVVDVEVMEGEVSLNQDTQDISVTDPLMEDYTVTTTPNVVDLATLEPSMRVFDPLALDAWKRGDAGVTHVPGELIVQYNDRAIDLSTTKGRKASSFFVRANGLKKVDELREHNMVMLKVEDGKSVVEKINEIADDPTVASVQPNYQYTVATLGTDDLLGNELWGLDNVGQEVAGHVGTPDADIDAPEAWQINEGTNVPVIVAVIDTGVAYNHPDLAPNMWDGSSCKDENGVFLGGCNHGYDFEDEDVTPFPTYSPHGTHVAGTIAGVKGNGIGIAGVAPHAQIMALKTSLTTFELVRSINFATQNGASIINASWGGTVYGDFSEEDLLLKNAIAGFPGLFITASGNSFIDIDATGSDVHVYPSSFDLPNIISVAATDQNDELASFSNYGLVTVDVAAPGVNIYSAMPGIDTMHYTEYFDTVTAPAIPTTWEMDALATWGTVESGTEFGNVLYGDVAYPYQDSKNSFITSATYPLQDGSAVMDFFAGCDTEYSPSDWSDYMQLEYSADGINFTPETEPIVRWDEFALDYYSGDVSLSDEGASYFYFTDVTIPREYATENFTFRFRWVSNDTDNNHDGCFVDSVEIHQSQFGDGEDYVQYDGTSMATPHVAGLVALIQGYNSALTPLEVKDIILSSGDSLPSLVGKTVSGKRINAHTALSLAGATKVIQGFTIPSQVGETQIDPVVHTIALTMPADTNSTNLVPVVTFLGASMSPVPGSSVDFTNPVTYTVTALDGTQVEYTVTVSKQPQIQEPEPRRSSGGGGGGGGKSKKKIRTVVSATPVVSEGVTVAQPQKNHFTQTMTLGARGTHVIELQKVLIAGKHLMVTTPTGYYGPLTATAVRAYQKAHNLPETGSVDAQTLAVLNTSTSETQDSKAQLIAQLMQKVQELTLELARIKKQ